MAFKNLTAFGAGEISPKLYERGNLDKFRTGLKRLRNTTVTKTGGLQGRGGMIKFITPKYSDRTCIMYFSTETNTLFEIGDQYIRRHYNLNETTLQFANMQEVVGGTYSDVTLARLTDIHITSDDKYMYLFHTQFRAIRVQLSSVSLVSRLDDHVNPENDLLFDQSFTADNTGYTAPTGTDCDYGVTWVIDGVETYIVWSVATRKVPAAVGQGNRVVGTVLGAATYADLDIQMRVYRRPRGTGGWGFAGSATPEEVGGNFQFIFVDVGVSPDYTNSPPEFVAGFMKDTSVPVVDTPGAFFNHIYSKTGFVFQGRVMFSGTKNKQLTFGTRPELNLMTRDFPLQDDSAVSFRSGSDGGASVKRYFDSRGLMQFTNAGIYETVGDLLTPFTAYAIKRSNVVTDDKVPPLGLEDSILVPDLRQKSIIALYPTGDTAMYQSSEISIFSEHLLRNRRVISWTKQGAEAQYVWMVLDNGLLLSLSYHKEHQMQAWAWHDTDGLFEYVSTITTPSGTEYMIALVNRGGVRTIERLPNLADMDFMNYVGADSAVIYKNDLVTGVMTVTPVVPGAWDGSLVLTSTTDVFQNIPLFGQVGSIFRVFKPDGSPIDLRVTVFTNTKNVTVVPHSDGYTYPSSLATPKNLYVTRNVFTGLEHLNGKQVSVRADGFTKASPLNTQRDLPTYTVVGGQITLEEEYRGAIVSIGLPYAQDIQTLPVDTVEQSPTKLEAMIVNKLNLSYFESLPYYAAAQYPPDNTVDGMDMQAFERVQNDGTWSTLAPPPPITERREVQIDGDWKAEGSICLRNVDPQPTSLLAIIPDGTITSRGRG